ncbi:L-asparaginase [Ilyonectria robusta]
MQIITPQDYQNNTRKRQRRSPRPCDACRKRKSRCMIKAGDSECLYCQLRPTACTFEHDPPERQKTAGASSNGAYSGDERGGGGGGLDDLPGLSPGVGGIGYNHHQGPSLSRSRSLGRGCEEDEAWMQGSLDPLSSETRTPISETQSFSLPAETQASKDSIREHHHIVPELAVPDIPDPDCLLSYFVTSHGPYSNTEPSVILQPYDSSAICYGEDQRATSHLPPNETAVESNPTQLLADSVEGPSTINPAIPNVLFIGTGGTIAGVNLLHEPATEYTPGVLGIDKLVKDNPQLVDVCNVWYKQVANIDSVNMDFTILRRILLEVQDGLNNPEYAGVVVLHGTDTLEETAQFIQLTTFSDNPVVLTGAVRPSTDPSPDGPMNILGSAVVASSADSKKRGALCVFNNKIHSASTIRKQDSNSIDAFTSKSVLGTVHNNKARFLSCASRPIDHHYFDVNGIMTLPRVEMLSAYQGRTEDNLTDLKQKGIRGLVLEGFGEGYWPEGPITRSSAVARHNFPVVIASRTICGFVAGRYGFMGAGDLSSLQARVKLQLAIATDQDLRNFFAK